jgi:hypothetical protein
LIVQKEKKKIGIKIKIKTHNNITNKQTKSRKKTSGSETIEFQT